MIWKLSPSQLRERMVEIIGRKRHWAAPHFDGCAATKEQCNVHFRQEYAVYIRDFSVLLARIVGKTPPWRIRRHLATTIYEKETGKLSLGKPHQELFLEMMMKLGYKRAEFRDVELLARSYAYREWLDNVCEREEWIVGAAVLTIFVEGTAHDREDAFVQKAQRPAEAIEAVVAKHPLARYHGLLPEHLGFIRAQEMIEPCNRSIAYDLIVQEAVESGTQALVMEKLETGLKIWLQYRDGVAHACGLRQQ